MNTINKLYQDHLATLQQRAQHALAKGQAQALLIHSGELSTVFLDDHTYPFKVNPQFKAWLPVTQTPNCWLWIDGVNRPKLFFYSPIDYWHKVDALPETYWSDAFDIIALTDAQKIAELLPAHRQEVVYIGPTSERARALGIEERNINPRTILNVLDYHRSYKTDYELYCLRKAQSIAVRGHQAARHAFYQGASEFEINNHYLLATQQRDTSVPYGNIVALNENAAVLHYTQLDIQAPSTIRSFLLDAGAEYQGYAADLTRSYAFDPNSEFAALIKTVNQHELALVDSLQLGSSYIDYHRQMNHRIANILLQFNLINGLSEEALVEQNITSAFMPHGLGHSLGLQVHDVAGFMQDPQGTHLAPPSVYPWLRCTRRLEPRMVLTIEPGIYFVESLLAPWRESALNHHFDWQAIEQFKPFGGIRIEDNVIITAEGVENMTRDLLLD